MKVSEYQHDGVDPNDFGLQNDLPMLESHADTVAQPKHETPSMQQSLLEPLRSKTDPKQYGLPNDMRKSGLSGPNIPQGKADGRVDLQRSTVERLQSSGGSAANAPAASGGDADTPGFGPLASGISTASSASSASMPLPASSAQTESTASTAPTASTVSTISTAPAASAASSAQKLLDKYDGGSGQQSQSYTRDTNTTGQLVQYLKRGFTGMPPNSVRDSTTVAGMSAQMAQMDESTREGYIAGAAAALNQPPAQRAVRVMALTGAVSQEAHDIERDPVKRLTAIFNTPVGTQFLDGGGQAQTDALRRQYDAFIATKPGDAGDAVRAKAVESAVRIKTQMQTEIGKAIATKDASEQKVWDESAKRVGQILDEAEKYATHTIIVPTPGTDDTEWNDRRAEAYKQTFAYQSIGEKLLSQDMLSGQERDHPGWWPESVPTLREPKDISRDLLTFQQGLNDPNSTISKRVQALESRAVHELTANGDKEYLDQVATPKLYKDITAALPQTDGKYVQNLAQKYIDTTQDIDEKSRGMLREHKPDTLDKALYTVGKVLNSLSPMPGLDWLAGELLNVAIPNHGGLTPNQEGLIDTALPVINLLLGGVDKLPLLKEKFAEHEGLENVLKNVHTPEPVQKPSLPETARDEISRVLETPSRAGGTRAAQAGDEKMAAAGSTSALTRGGPLSAIPKSYIQPQPDAIWNSERYPGLMEDNKNNTYVVDGENVYAVKHDGDNATWRIYDPRASSRPAYPIRAGQDGGWELHGNVGLKGGMMGDGDGVGQPGPSSGRQAGASGGSGQPPSIEDTVNRWVGDQDQKYTSITKKYSPGELNLNGFEHRTVMVSDEVFKTLTDAQKINEKINTLLPYGSGNQHWDVHYTQGESAKRVSVGQFMSATADDMSAKLFATCLAGGGNCSDMAQLVLNLAGDKFRSAPVMRVTETDSNGGHVDHTYVLVGDPRDPRYGASTVVIDPWPSFPTAHTTGTGAVRPWGPVESSRHEPTVPGLETTKPMSKQEIDNMYSMMYGDPSPNSVLTELYTRDGQRKFVWTQRTSGNDMSTTYKSPSNPGGIKLNKLPDYIVERYDPYIKTGENHNGPLFPSNPPAAPAAQALAPPADEQIIAAWNNLVRDAERNNVHLTAEQWNRLADIFPPPH